MSLEDDDNISLADLPSSDEFSDLEDDALQELFDSDEDEDEFEGFGFDLPENMTWERQHFAVSDEPLTYAPGPTMDLPDSGKAIDFFLLYFSEEIIRNIVQFTKNAEVKRARNWQPLTQEELKAFLAALIISNDLIVVPRDKHYFLFHIPGVKSLLKSRKRFCKLKSYIYFCDPEHELTEEESRGTLYKVRAIYNKLVTKFKELFNCSSSINEAMVLFKGKLAIKVRMPDKPVKFGVKIFDLRDAKTGYCENFMCMLDRITDRQAILEKLVKL